jgi:hypothetical protein
MRANPPSGDWRMMNRNLELIASLAVPVPGLPITRSQLALSASIDGDLEVSALILTGPTVADFEPPAELTRTEYLRRRHALAASVR